MYTEKSKCIIYIYYIIINVVENKYKVVEHGKTQVKNLKIVLENSIFHHWLLEIRKIENGSNYNSSVYLFPTNQCQYQPRKSHIARPQVRTHFMYKISPINVQHTSTYSTVVQLVNTRTGFNCSHRKTHLTADMYILIFNRSYGCKTSLIQ